MKKCEKCELVASLKARIAQLESRIDALVKANVRKVHFELDNETTACGINLNDSDVEISDDITAVTCILCRKKWDALKKEWMSDNENDFPDRWPDVPDYYPDEENYE